MPLRQLDQTTINQIAAGEVVERPASVIKELVENAVDAGATRIEIVTSNGGKSFIRVSDNGAGMTSAELPLAISRHCTSKLEGGLNAIASLGFRGEALPSIGSMSRLTITSRTANCEHASRISVEGGHESAVTPSPGNKGTTVEVRDLFYATPARLKFMKGDRAENAAVTDVIKRIALAVPQVGFFLSGDDRQPLNYPACAGEDALSARIAQVLGDAFVSDAVMLDAEREGARLTGLTSLPSVHRGQANMQFAFVNGRPIKDRQVLGALRAAYSDYMARDRHPISVFNIAIDPALVDVNVHPAKADVRFRDPGNVRALIIGGIRRTLDGAGIRASRDASQRMADAFAGTPSANHHHATGFAETRQATFDAFAPSAPANDERTPEADEAPAPDYPLGVARAQVHDSFIVSQTDDGIIVVDQHAAHERIVFEALKTAMSERALPSQVLLVPEIVDLGADAAARLLADRETLERLGLEIDAFGPGAVAINATPAMLGETDGAALVRDLADDLMSDTGTTRLRDRLEAVASSMACHGSVRAGRRMKPDEMNALLRQMEATPGSGTGNHGRPTFVILSVSQIEALFGRP
ncbi:MAG: DNA mismatch repair endonuclease MutL [Pseudomonadota bacterium]